MENDWQPELDPPYLENKCFLVASVLALGGQPLLCCPSTGNIRVCLDSPRNHATVGRS